MAMVGLSKTVTTTESVLVQFKALRAVTTYVPGWEMEIVLEVEPLDQL